MRKVFIASVILITFILGYHEFKDSSANISYVGNSFKFEIPFEEQVINDFSLQYKLFKKAKLEGEKYVYRTGNYKIVFTVNPELQESARRIFKAYKLKYGAYVAIEPSTGKVLCALSSIDYPDLTVKTTFPTASTFKVVTAAAAIEYGLANPDSKMVCGGYGDSCSPTVWLNSKYKVVRNMRTSFATSANPYFGNLGRIMGKQLLLQMAEKFGFNRKDYGFPWGRVETPVDDYQLALTSAGLENSMTSPFHEALISAAVLNGGVMPKPTFVERIEKGGKVVYVFKPSFFGRVISEPTADVIKDMMEGTVKFGTASQKRYFRIFKRRFRNLESGGKTGTLSELTYPEGRCEWFVGFFRSDDLSLAVASLAVNERKYYVTGYDISPLVLMEFLKGRKRCVYSAR